MKRFMNKKLLVVGVAVALVIGVGGAAFAYFTSSGTGTGSAQVATATNLNITQLGSPIYDSTVYPLPGSMVSQAFQATQTSEFGNEINLASSSSPLDTVVVTMESWTCGNYSTGSKPCTTTPGTSYPLPITFTIYRDAGSGAVGSVLATDTQTFNIPFRPSRDLANCPDGTGWYNDAATAALYGVTPDNQCHHGLANNITLNFSSLDVVLPSTVIYGISYNTSNYGPTPLGGSNNPSDSLNVAFTTSDVNPTVGSDVYVGQLDQSTTTAAWYCDDGAGGVGVFRLDAPVAATAPCTSPSQGGWSANSDGYGAPYYVPAVQFNAEGPVGLYPGGPAQPINFSVTNSDSIPQQLNSVTIVPASDPGNGNVIESSPGYTSTDVAGCYAIWFSVNGGNPIAISQNLPAGDTIVYSGLASISMSNPNYNQDNCQGQTVGLVYTSN